MYTHIHSIVRSLLIVGIGAVAASSAAWADEQTDKRIDPAKVKDAMDFARTNKAFAETSAANLDENAPPRGIDDSDPVAVKEIVAMEKEMEKSYNTEFLTNPGATVRFWSTSPNRTFFDIATPGEYVGDQVLQYYKFIGPQFIGRLEFKEIKVYAKGGVGFVYMKQNYYGKSLDGQPIHWIMRQTDGVVKQEGKWRILHSHISYPVDLMTAKADFKSAKTPLPWDRAKPAAGDTKK